MVESSVKVIEESTKGGFYLSLGNIISGVLSALSLVVIARALGSPAQYGLYTLSTVIPSLFFLFVNPGINQAIMRFSARLRVRNESEDLGKILYHGLFFETFISVILFLACFFFAEQLGSIILNRSGIGGFIQLASFIIIFQAIFKTLNAIFIGFDKTEYQALTTVIQSIAKTTIAPLLVLIGLSVAGAIIGYVASLILACLFAGSIFLFKIYKPLKNFNKVQSGFLQNLKLLISYGFPLYISMLLFGFSFQFRNILLSLFASNHSVGNFQAAINFNIIIESISIPIATMLLPAFSKLEEKKKSYKELFGISIKYSSLLILPITILLIIYSSEVINIIYGEGFELASSYLALYTISFLFVGIGYNTIGSFFSGIGDTKTHLRITLAQILVFIILAPLLGYYIGVYGIILAVIISPLARIIYGLQIAGKDYGIKIDKKIISRIYIIAILSGIPLLFLKFYLQSLGIIYVVLGISCYAMTYLFLIPATGVITKIELTRLRIILEKIKLLNYFASPLLSLEEKILDTCLWKKRQKT